MTSPFAETLVHDGGLEPSLPTLERQAARAVVLRDDHVLMLRTSAGTWKFPGGGVKPGESDAVALHREVGEECGLEVAFVDGYLGEVVERSAALPDDPFPVFVQVSRYYRCTLGAGSGALALSAGERALGLAPAWVTFAAAIRANRARLDGPHRFVRRELLVLERLDRGSG